MARARTWPTRFTNPIDTMLAYLQDPDRASWARRGAAAVAGLMTGMTQVASSVDRAGAAAALHAQLTGDIAPPGNATPGAIHVLRSTDRSGLPILIVPDATRGDTPADVAWTALALLDDGADVGTVEHKLRWRAWLYWSNLLQFLDDRGNGVQLATSTAATFPVDTLAVCHGEATAPTPSTPISIRRRDKV